ncbi:MAG: hypothetical protein LBP19_03455 [Treponema sp.]|nr:hypothetical protein [Treponema sp.]
MRGGGRIVPNAPLLIRGDEENPSSPPRRVFPARPRAVSLRDRGVAG